MFKKVVVMLTGTAMVVGAAYACEEHQHQESHHHHHHASSHSQTIDKAVEVSKLPEAKGLEVTDCWIRLMPKKFPSSAYFKLTNTSNEDKHIHDVYSLDFGHSEYHTTKVVDGKMKMEKLTHFDIKPGQTVSFEPKGNHVMLMKSKGTLQVGDKAHLIILQKDAKVSADCVVKEPGTL
ncbi:copper chaperone PCu(A)C [Basilea psittacipulmonis]|uniref:copper chaperone PCu(A)C n=1 Tax=Basilea psittacipulmonis TaxID=1472345 RepID=UPI00068F6E78|nr:copper chaperone PCu(A)C [Basilea psittacipulmonis]